MATWVASATSLKILWNYQNRLSAKLILSKTNMIYLILLEPPLVRLKVVRQRHQNLARNRGWSKMLKEGSKGSKMGSLKNVVSCDPEDQNYTKKSRILPKIWTKKWNSNKIHVPYLNIGPKFMCYCDFYCSFSGIFILFCIFFEKSRK